jgi:hypothetical protein
MQLIRIVVMIWRLRLARCCFRIGRFFADLGQPDLRPVTTKPAGIPPPAGFLFPYGDRGEKDTFTLSAHGRPRYFRSWFASTRFPHPPVCFVHSYQHQHTASQSERMLTFKNFGVWETCIRHLHPFGSADAVL